MVGKTKTAVDRPRLHLSVRYDGASRSVDIETGTDDGGCGIYYSLMDGLYTTGHGYGCQVDDEARREAVERMCHRIADAVLEYVKEVD